MAEETQTEKDTKKAASKVTRSGEYQARVDAAAKAKAQTNAQPTNVLAKNQSTAEESRKARNKANRTERTQSDTDRAAGRVTRSGEYQRRIDAAAEAEQVGTKQGNVDFTSASTTASSGGGGESLAGIEIIWADQTETFITAADILDDYDGEDYWSVVFAVSSRAFTKATPTYDATQELWDDVGTAQTVYRLRVKTLNTVASPNASTQLSAYGQYREEILCVNGDPVVNLVKIS